MPTTPTLTLCDQLVAALALAWAPAGDDGVERVYQRRMGDGEDAFSELKGRRVLIYPLDYDNDPATRGEDEFEHRVAVQVFERYTAQGDPPVAWVDDLVDFVYDRVVQGFDFGRRVPAWNPKLWTKSADVRVYDIDHLVGNKVFFSEVSLVFGEIRDDS